VSSLQARLRAHAAIPLYRSAYALMSSVAATAALGFLFWAAASRAYSAHAVGVSSAAIAALTFLTGVGGLFLDGVLYRFLPRAGDKTNALLRWAALATTTSATAAAAIFIAGLHVWAPDLSFVTSSPWTVFAAIGSVVVSCLLVVADGALIGFRRAGWVPIKGVTYGVAKVVILLVCVYLAPGYGIVLAWITPSAFILAASIYLVVTRVAPAHRSSDVEAEEIGPGVVARYGAGNYVAFLCNLAYRTLPPLLVIHELGATSSAYFYVPWQILVSLVLLTNNLSVSLVVEGSLDPKLLALQTRRALRQFIRLILPISIVLLIAAPWVLRIFGPRYAAHGGSLLRLLALGLIPASISIIAIGVARVRGRVGVIIATQVAIAVVVVGLGVVFLHIVGLTGFGISWLIAQSAAAWWLSLSELRPVLKPRAAPRRPPVPPRIQTLEEELEKFERDLRDAFAWLESPGRPT
jgi:O-antigen/teichoic acid export membrane protein